MKLARPHLLALVIVSTVGLVACGETDSTSVVDQNVFPTKSTPEEKFAATFKAAEQGDVYAMYSLGKMYVAGTGVPQDHIKGRELYLKAAKLGNADAQTLVALIYRFGALGVPKDPATGIEWLRKAAEQGNTEAQFRLGAEYDEGKNLPQNLAQAAYLFRKAAEQGHARAQENLALMYGTGQGVQKDLAEAAYWHRKAADQGNDKAQLNLGMMYVTGEGVPKDFTKALAWWQKSAAQGNAESQYNLALLYGGKGDGGIQIDNVLAYAWLNLAAAQGDQNAKGARDALEKELAKKELQEAQLLSSNWKSGQILAR